jgi:hypothetical protein
MRLPIRLLIPAVAVTCTLLTGCQKEGAEESFTSTPTYTAAHPIAPEGQSGSFAPPVATYAYPQGSSGPGTATYVPAETQPDVVAFVDRELEQVKQLIQDGKLGRASSVLSGLELRRSSWSLDTQREMDPKIAAVQKTLGGGQSEKG